ncbi:hypothetical protein Acr_27g0000050 [Actinidia rufa]|uniref:Uncharacterized protein n=1 Tax=Actinidia rufa TaxID=165716 RepID=A0A7J0H589_9ERIC|nr:hypothetical protein Acr_27g0000050 [Actinidia rufa]
MIATRHAKLPYVDCVLLHLSSCQSILLGSHQCLQTEVNMIVSDSTSLLQLRYYLHMAIFSYYAVILDHSFLNWESKLKINTYGSWSSSDGSKKVLTDLQNKNNEKCCQNYSGNGSLTVNLDSNNKRRRCKGIKYTTTDARIGGLRLAVAGKQARRTPGPELGAVFLNIDFVRAKAIVAKGLPLLIELGSSNCARAQTGTMFGSHPEGCQGTGGDLHNEVSFDSLHTQMNSSET